MESQIMTHIPRKKSEPLSKQELRSLKAYRKGFGTDTTCAGSIGIDRNVLNRVLLVGSAAPDTVQKIRAVIKAIA